jgi:hypothetical protein
MLAYGRSGPDPIPGTQVASIVKDAGFVQCNLLGDWSAGARGTQGYFAYRDDFAVLAFRGTEKDDWHDLAADLPTWPVDEDVTPRSAGRLEKTMFHLPSARAVFDSSKVGVHRGFQAALNEVWSDTARNLTEYTGPAAKARSSLPDTASGQLWRHSPSRGLAPGCARQQEVIKAAGNHLAKNAALLCDGLLNRHSDGALLAVVSRLWPQVPRPNGNQK